LNSKPGFEMIGLMLKKGINAEEKNVMLQ